MSDRFRINTPHVVAETLDGETTVVNLDTGTYYALNASGSLIWDELTSGAPTADVETALVAEYEIEGERAAAAVAGLLEELRRNDLVAAFDGDASGNGAAPAPSSRGSAAQYVEPELSTYTDMQELLLLDPIHEVDEAGWPNRPF